MIAVKLKSHPADEPQEVDGLVWGGPKPEPFLGMTKKRNGLIGRNGTYLFRPVCYDAPSCFVPQRSNTPDHPCRSNVSEYPDSDPVEIVRIEGWYSEDEVRKQIEEWHRRQKVKMPLPDDFDRPKSKWRKQEWIKIGIQYGLDEDALAGMKKEEVRQEALRAQVISRTHPNAFRLYLYMEAIVGEEEATRLMNSIHFAVKYRNGEVLYLSDLERLARDVGSPGAGSEHEIKDLVKFAVNFAAGTMTSAAGEIILSYESNSRHGDLAIKHLFENLTDGWIDWKVVIKAADNPTSWQSKRSPLRHLHGGNKGAKKEFFGRIIEARKNSYDGWEIRLNPKYCYKVE